MVAGEIYISWPADPSTEVTERVLQWNGFGDSEHSQPGKITQLLSRLNEGDRQAFDELMPLVYHELHRIAEGYARRESRSVTLQPTALVHEAYLRLAACNAEQFRSRAHFFGIAARAMRQILVDHARARLAEKRGADLQVAYNPRQDVAQDQDRIVLSLNDALHALAREDARKAGLVEMRFFGGMTAEEIAACVETPVQSVRRELRAAQAWLRREIEG